MRMIHTYSTKELSAILSLAISLFITVSCGGSAIDPTTATTSSSGNTEIYQLVAATSVSSANINRAKIDVSSGNTTVNFSLYDSDGAAIATLPSGFSASDMRFTFAQLQPASNTGDTSRWQSYINRKRTSSSYDKVTQAHYEKLDAGQLTYAGDGSWDYIFSFNINSVSSPVSVTYDPTYTHRVGLQFTGNSDNPTLDFRPDSNPIVETRKIISVDDCNKCHGTLALHGGGRLKVEFCVTCHNEGTTGVMSNNDHISLDLQAIVHKIHYGKDLPSNVAGETGTGSGNYNIVGYRDSVHKYDEISYPRKPGVQDCTNCHIESDETPDFANWKKKPTMNNCGSCHDTVNFSTGENHGSSSLVQNDNTQCAVCHTEDDIDSVHRATAQAVQNLAAQYQYNVHSISNNSPGSAPIITFSMTDPTNNDAPYDVTASDNSFNINVGWSTSDYTNFDSSKLPRPTSVKSTAATSNGDGTYTVTMTDVIPATATGSGVVMIDGHPKGTITGTSTTTNVPVTNLVKYFTITDSSAQSRREVVSTDKCLNCHGSLELHGSNRNNEVQSCVVCHNPVGTDINRRSGVGVDGKYEESIDFKTMIHAIHGASKRVSSGGNAITVYGFGGTAHNYNTSTVHYPGDLKNCETCHNSDTYTVPLASNVLATTGNTMSSSTDTSDDLIITPTAAVCSSCHAGTNAKLHMQQNGATFESVTRSVFEAGSNTESCAVCHAEGRTSAVKSVHGIE